MSDTGTTRGTAHTRGTGGTRSATVGRAELPDSSWRVVDSPVGRLLLVAGTRGVIRVAFEREGLDAVVAAVADRVGSTLEPAPTVLDAAARELAEYFAGDRRRFEVPVDFALSSGFRRTVQQGLTAIDYGTTATYRELAERAGNARAVRAVGTACATNPLPVLVPCHRVVRTDGGLGGYLGGLEAKTLLLDLERGTPAGAVPA